MTGRAASTTAVLVCQGRAAADGLLGVGRFQTRSNGDLLTLAAGLDLPSDADASLRNGCVAVAVRR